MEKDIGTWNEKGLGFKLGDERRDFVSNLRFADDVLILANSLKQLQRLMTYFKRSTEAQGLEIRPDKKKILTNQESNRLKETEIDGMHVEIIHPEGIVKYLEQMITFMDQETTEVQHRIRCAWSAFARDQQELTSKSYLLRHRLHLFDAVITPTIMYGAGTWTTTKEHEHRIRTAQRRMLWPIIQTKTKIQK